MGFCLGLFEKSDWAAQRRATRAWRAEREREIKAAGRKDADRRRAKWDRIKSDFANARR